MSIVEEAEGEVTVDVIEAKVKQLGNRVEAPEVEEVRTWNEDIEAEGARLGAEAEASSTVGEQFQVGYTHNQIIM